jgi:biopolymer transport protein TolR
MSMGDPGRKGMLAEINVTPLVDVMLVLLIIFMISSSIETMQVQQDRDRQKQVDKSERLDQKVPVNLPRTDAEPVNLAQEKKLVLSITSDLQFFVGDTLVVDCLPLAPALKALTGTRRDAWGRDDEKAFKPCLDALATKLAANEKLKRDQEMYLRADQGLPYGLTLKVMAKVRASGVAKFGLVADPEG